MSRWTHSDHVIGRRRARIRNPYYHALPVVPVAQGLRGVVLREVPGVHQGVSVGIGCVGLAAAHIDLASATAAVAVGGASRFEATAVVLSIFVYLWQLGGRLKGEVKYPVLPSASTAGNGTQPSNTFRYG